MTGDMIEEIFCLQGKDSGVYTVLISWLSFLYFLPPLPLCVKSAAFFYFLKAPTLTATVA